MEDAELFLEPELGFSDGFEEFVDYKVRAKCVDLDSALAEMFTVDPPEFVKAVPPYRDKFKFNKDLVVKHAKVKPTASINRVIL